MFYRKFRGRLLAPEDQLRALLLGARRYVVKPPDFDGLVRDVKWICASFLPLPA